MFAVIYKWRLKQGKEEQFIASWRRMTTAIHESCGSYGSRLHRADDGTWVAYARWPDAATRERCQGTDPEALESMREAIEEYFPETRCEVTDDMLAEPRD
ncbi:hypothetical protein GCM10009801_20320 [Streptomyces albiaxialis]|uniref:ABM domain-containing protein n=1 Tax=Streptomyces albiaxialis TaxID=329523 RepID=A0ABN2VRG7_9ACTN